jgi:bifunctional non-homologous end joining protein LigD
MPQWIVPMAATLTQARFTGPEWIFERKFDGIRVLAFKGGREVRLLSRNRLPQHIPSIASAIVTLPVHDVILDGEMTWRELGIEEERSGSDLGPAGPVYRVFDIAWLEGRDITSLPLDERRSILNGIPLRMPLARVSPLSDAEPWERARREGWEGVIAKRRDSKYEHRRSPHWLKMKCELVQDFVVGGFTDPQGARAGLGALLVGYFKRDEFVFAGKVGTGFDTTLLLELRKRLDALEIPGAPFTRAVGLPRVRAHWVKPEILVHVAFIEWTVHGKLRHARLLGVGNRKPSPLPAP